jgi:alkylhydroperoxidase family enzyme
MQPYMAKDAIAGAAVARTSGVDLGALGEVVARYTGEDRTRPDFARYRQPTGPDDKAAFTRARDEDITGLPPRIPPLEEWDDEMRALAVKPPPGHEQVRSIFLAVLLHNPEFVRSYRDILTHFLVRGALPLRIRELAILRVAWLTQVPFEWGEHVKLGKQAGLTSGEIERVTQGSSASGWTDEDRAVLCAAEELIQHAMISDSTWSTLAGFLRPGLLIELVACVGQYQALGYLYNALRIPLSDGNIGLPAR